MGLFSRQKSQAEQPRVDVGPRQVDPESIDLEQARTIVTTLVQAIGSDAMMRRALLRLQQASGMPDPDNAGAQMAAFQEDPQFATRLWRWLRVVAEKANDEGQGDIAAMAAFWSFVWSTTVVPHMVGADFISLGFDKAPDDALDAILEAGGTAIAGLADGFVVAQTAEPNTVTAAILRTAFPASEGALDRPHAEEKMSQAPEAGSSSPSPADIDAPGVLPLQPGEQRVIQVVHRADGEKNEICVVRRRDGDDEFAGDGEPIEYVAIIVSSDGDSEKTPWAWQRASTVVGIYQRVAEAFRNAPPPDGFRVWNAPEVEEFLQLLK